MRLPFRIKVCGLTTPQNAEACASAGAEAIGLNFYPPSPRYVTVEQARQIAAVLPAEVTPVGLFVNATPEVIHHTATEVGLRWVQLHGEEPPELLAELAAELAIIRVYRHSDWGAIANDLAACRQAGRMPDAVLVDAQVAGQFGGTGHTADWNALAQRGGAEQVPLILAGGLTPANVVEAIRQVRPSAVDTASGVEHSPGIKDPQVVKQFVTAACNAWAIA